MRVNGCNFVQKLGKQWDKQQLSWISVEGLATSVWNIWSIAHVPEGGSRYPRYANQVLTHGISPLDFFAELCK
jgi:hypothetical protein